MMAAGAQAVRGLFVYFGRPLTLVALDRGQAVASCGADLAAGSPAHPFPADRPQPPKRDEIKLPSTGRYRDESNVLAVAPNSAS